MIGDERRVLVGFDRGGWPQELFENMVSKSFDALTWRKGSNIPNLPEKQFVQVTHIDEHGEKHMWDKTADTQG